jgi:hypothetical protein
MTSGPGRRRFSVVTDVSEEQRTFMGKNNPLAKKLRDLSDRVGDDCSK